MPNATTSPLYVIVGPTASGKSALGIRLASRVNGIIINMDAMQLYRDLPILSAQPTLAEQAATPHALYGVLDATDKAEAARWAAMARQQIDAARVAGQAPILLGGTGLYLSVLLGGIADIPTVPAHVVAGVKALQAEIGTPALHEKLALVDPEAAIRLKAGDTQRVIRAYGVWLATGRSLSAWQQEAHLMPPTEADVRVLALMPDRAALYARINMRFDAMIEAGAIAEVQSLMGRQLPAGLHGGLPLLKAHGFPELSAYLEGRITRAEAAAQAQQITRNYAKRQFTWFRNQILVRRPNALEINDFGLSAAAEAGLEKTVNKT